MKNKNIIFQNTIFTLARVNSRYYKRSLFNSSAFVHPTEIQWDVQLYNSPEDKYLFNSSRTLKNPKELRIERELNTQHFNTGFPFTWLNNLEVKSKLRSYILKVFFIWKNL